jgi:fructose-1,6-bisphosphatase/sedoheptulose 1,7-bisphosphatase-like protein
MRGSTRAAEVRFDNDLAIFDCQHMCMRHLIIFTAIGLICGCVLDNIVSDGRMTQTAVYEAKSAGSRFSSAVRRVISNSMREIRLRG